MYVTCPFEVVDAHIGDEYAPFLFLLIVVELEDVAAEVHDL